MDAKIAAFEKSTLFHVAFVVSGLLSLAYVVQLLGH
jgi:hypothetical protein